MEEEEKCDPPGLTSWDVTGVIEKGERVKLGSFDPDPYPGECNYAGSTPLSGFPFGCKTLGMYQKTPICYAVSSCVSTGLQTVSVEYKSFGIQTLLPATPTDARPARVHCPPLALKEFKY